MAPRSGLEQAVAETSDEAGQSPLEHARNAYADCRWSDAYETLSQIDRRSALAAEDLELLASAALLLGHTEEGRHALLRAYQIHVNRGDIRQGARCAVRIGFQQLDTGEIAEVSGCLPASMSTCSAWVEQASALLQQEEECAEHGYLLIPKAYEQLAMEKNPDRAARTASQAAQIGRRFDDRDLLALALNIQGRAEVRSGRTHQGMTMLDEAVTMVTSGDVSSPISGIVLSSAIDASDEVFELARFDEWTHIMTSWSGHQKGMMAFRCRELTHLATLNRFHGRWDKALRLARQACQPTIADADQSAAAAAMYVQGEVHRLQGRLTAAEAAYDEAGRRGHDPQPGLALLRLAQGDVESANASVDRVLAESQDWWQRAAILPFKVEIMLAAGDVPSAAASAGELTHTAGLHDTPGLFARAEQARGAVLLAEGDPVPALGALRDASRVWRHLRMPYEEGRTRALMARCCRAVGDRATAELELGAARRIFSRLQAEPDLAATQDITGIAAESSTHRLTRRELEVLRLLATGMTNRAIADELVVGVRTVDSHVSSILTKLGVATRAAATSYAHRHGLA